MNTYLRILTLVDRQTRCYLGWKVIWERTQPAIQEMVDDAKKAQQAVLGIDLGPGWFGVLLVIWAPLVALARVAMRVHYISDVLARLLLGVVMGVGLLVVVWVS